MRYADGSVGSLYKLKINNSILTVPAGNTRRLSLGIILVWLHKYLGDDDIGHDTCDVNHSESSVDKNEVD